jgi:hypothetical protein
MMITKITIQGQARTSANSKTQPIKPSVLINWPQSRWIVNYIFGTGMSGVPGGSERYGA